MNAARGAFVQRAISTYMLIAERKKLETNSTL
jgi:hypothetical protein